MLMPLGTGNIFQGQNGPTWINNGMGLCRIPVVPSGPDLMRQPFPNFQINPTAFSQFHPLVPQFRNCPAGIPQSLHPPTSDFSPPKKARTSPASESNSPKNLQSPVESKKIRIFRPWDDSEPKPGRNSVKPSATSTVTHSGRPKSTGSRNSAVISVQDHHQSALETLATNLGKSGDGHRCIYCGKVYSRKYGLKIHLRTHTGFKPLKCKVCHRAFGDPSNLNKHTRLHAENGLAIKCHLCGKLLIRKRDLERHLVSRHDLGSVTRTDKEPQDLGTITMKPPGAIFSYSEEAEKEISGNDDVISGHTVLSESEICDEEDLEHSSISEL